MQTENQTSNCDETQQSNNISRKSGWNKGDPLDKYTVLIILILYTA